MDVTVKLVDSKVRFEGALRDLAPIAIDYTPPLGDGRGYLSLELFLFSLASCSGSTVAALLRRAGRTLSEFSVRASGVRRTEHPTSFSEVRLVFSVVSPDVQRADVEQAVRLSGERFCPVWAMVKQSVRIETDIVLEKPRPSGTPSLSPQTN